jgi:hypothetical protein
MNKKQTLMSAVLMLIVLVVGKNYLEERSARLQREELARELGLDPQIYGRIPYFPIGHFDETLPRGTPISQVHQIVKGYEAVFVCEDYIEMYYYYSTSDEDALIFTISYEDNKELKQKVRRNILTDDDNSGWLPYGNCTPGLLDIKNHRPGW